MAKQKVIITKVVAFIIVLAAIIGIGSNIWLFIEERQKETIDFDKITSLKNLRTNIGEIKSYYEEIDADNYQGSLSKEDFNIIYNNIKEGIGKLENLSFIDYKGKETIRKKEKRKIFDEVNKEISLGGIVKSYQIIEKEDKRLEGIVDLFLSHLYFTLVGSDGVGEHLMKNLITPVDENTYYTARNPSKLEMNAIIAHANNKATSLKFLAKWLVENEEEELNDE
ncbi:MAG: hypothetical protein ACOXZR_03125 [Bacilli bacterium]|jgi:predicted transcriptional regulator